MKTIRQPNPSPCYNHKLVKIAGGTTCHTCNGVWIYDDTLVLTPEDTKLKSSGVKPELMWVDEFADWGNDA